MDAGALYGADLGFEVHTCYAMDIITSLIGLIRCFQLAAGFAAVAYPPLRWLEIRFTGR